MNGIAVALDVPRPRAFDQACRMVVDYLARSVPMGSWVVTRVSDERQIMLVTADTDYGFVPGIEMPFTSTVCQYMITGAVPRIVRDVRAEPVLGDVASAIAALPVPITGYVGTPILHADGSLFGTVVGVAPEVLDADVMGQEELLDVFSSLLSSVLEADTSAVSSARELEAAVTDAETDALTGLLNRRGWERWLAREEDRYRRFGDPACVLMMDLDGLKGINDARGHEAGDSYLRRTAETLRRSVRHGDPLARLGGDEFALVATVEPAAAQPLVDRLQRALDEAGTPCSIGVAPVGVSTGFVEAVAVADAAMYHDKRFRKGLASGISGVTPVGGTQVRA